MRAAKNKITFTKAAIAIAMVCMMLMTTLVFIPQDAQAVETYVMKSTSRLMQNANSPTTYEAARSSTTGLLAENKDWRIGIPGNWPAIINRGILQWDIPSGAYTIDNATIQIYSTGSVGDWHLGFYAPLDPNAMMVLDSTDYDRQNYGVLIGEIDSIPTVGPKVITLTDAGNDYLTSRVGTVVSIYVAMEEEIGFPLSVDEVNPVPRYMQFFGNNQYGPKLLFDEVAIPIPATERHWDGGGADNLASNPLNWDYDFPFLDGHTAVFGTKSNKSCTWDLSSSVTIYQLWFRYYTGTFTQGAVNINIGVGGLVQESACTITANTAYEWVLNGPYLRTNGGVLTSYLMNLRVVASDVTITAGNFCSLYVEGSNVKIHGQWIVYGASGLRPSTLTVESGATVDFDGFGNLCLYYNGYLHNYGEITTSGTGFFGVRARDYSFTIDYGNVINSDLRLSLYYTASADRTVYLGADVECRSFLIQYQTSQVKTITLDCNGYSIYAKNSFKAEQLTKVMDIDEVYSASFDIDAATWVYNASGWVRIYNGGQFELASNQIFSYFQVWHNNTWDNITFSSVVGSSQILRVSLKSNWDYDVYIDGAFSQKITSSSTGDTYYTVSGSHTYWFRYSPNEWMPTVTSSPWAGFGTTISISQGYTLAEASLHDQCFSDTIQVNESSTLSITGLPPWITVQSLSLSHWRLNGISPFAGASYTITFNFTSIEGKLTRSVTYTLIVLGSGEGWSPYASQVDMYRAVQNHIYNGFIKWQGYEDGSIVSNPHVEILSMTKPSWLYYEVENTSNSVFWYFSGTPSTFGNVQISVHVRAVEGGGTTWFNMTLAIYKAWAPTISNIAPSEYQNVVIGHEWEWQYTANETVVWDCLDLPSGVYLDNGKLFGTPDVLGKYSIHVTARSVNGTGTATTTLYLLVYEEGQLYDPGSVNINQWWDAIILLLLMFGPALGLALIVGRVGFMIGTGLMITIWTIVNPEFVICAFIIWLLTGALIWRFSA